MNSSSDTTTAFIKSHKSKVKEGDIRAELKRRVESWGGEIRATAYLGKANCPDVMALLPFTITSTEDGLWSAEDPPSHVMVETKCGNKGPNAAQAREHERLRAARMTVLVIGNLAALDQWLPE